MNMPVKNAVGNGGIADLFMPLAWTMNRPQFTVRERCLWCELEFADYFGCDFSMLETMYQAIFHDPSR